jgi:hypothetical protein
MKNVFLNLLYKIYRTVFKDIKQATNYWKLSVDVIMCIRRKLIPINDYTHC